VERPQHPQPKATIDAILLHEAVEKVTLDADNPIELYDEGADHGAHEVATCGEHDSGPDPERPRLMFRGTAGGSS